MLYVIESNREQSLSFLLNGTSQLLLDRVGSRGQLSIKLASLGPLSITNKTGGNDFSSMSLINLTVIKVAYCG